MAMLTTSQTDDISTFFYTLTMLMFGGNVGQTGDISYFTSTVLIVDDIGDEPKQWYFNFLVASTMLMEINVGNESKVIFQPSSLTSLTWLIIVASISLKELNIVFSQSLK